jgi:hypothetical protein
MKVSEADRVKAWPSNVKTYLKLAGNVVVLMAATASPAKDLNLNIDNAWASRSGKQKVVPRDSTTPGGNGLILLVAGLAVVGVMALRRLDTEDVPDD